MKTLSFTPTKEQVDIVNEAKLGKVLKINAFAGSGKTSTLELLAHNLEKPSLYITFNKRMADEAQGRFPEWVEVRTAHSLAFQAEGQRLREKLQRPSGAYKNVCGNGGEVARHFRLAPYFVGEKVITSAMMGYAILNTVRHYEYSADKELRVHHVCMKGTEKVIKDKLFNQKDYKERILGYAKRLWDLRIDDKSNILCSHDTYMKLYQLSKPQLSKYEVIYSDESQDINACLLDILGHQKTSQVIFVGDEFQAIYGFRGAVNAMKDIEGTTLSLTKSFRFGESLAGVASTFLFNEVGVIDGNEVVETKINGEEFPKEGYVKIYRTNSAMLEDLITLMEDGVKVKAKVNTWEMVNLLNSLQALRDDNMKQVKHVDVVPYSSWKELVDVLEYINDPELKRCADIVKDYKELVFLNTLKNYQEPLEPEVELMTAHASKGLEWDYVWLAEDFKDLDKEKEGSQEYNLLYVAMTRAKKGVILNSVVNERVAQSNPQETLKLSNIKLTVLEGSTGLTHLKGMEEVFKEEYLGMVASDEHLYDHLISGNSEEGDIPTEVLIHL